MSVIPARRKIKWCDWLHRPRPDDETVAHVPVFMFPEGRSSEFVFDEETQEMGYKPPPPSDATLLGWIREAINDPTLGPVEICDYIGHPYIAMRWADRRHYWTAMEAFLAHGISVMPQCRLTGFWFPPSALIRPWTPLVAEAVVARITRQQMEEDPRLLKLTHHFCYTHQESWLTRDGRDLVTWMRLKQHLSRDPSSSDEEADTVTLGDNLVPSEPMIAPRPATDDDHLCVICMERPANTLALPCEHQVCCRPCSDLLKATPNAHTCVYCRQPLTGVAQDETTPGGVGH